MLKKLVLKRKLLRKIPLKEFSSNDFLDSSKLLDHIELHQFLKKCLEYIKEHNLKPRNEETKQIISYWNKIPNQRFTRHKTNNNGSTFKTIMTLITYRMHFHSLAIADIFKAIDKFDKNSNANGMLLYLKKLKLSDHFLWSAKKYMDKEWFEICIQDETTMTEESFGIKINFKNTYEKIKKSYVKIFYENNEGLGKDIVFRNAKQFIRFSEQIVDCHKTKVMCNYRSDLETLIDDYFIFVQELTSNSKWTASTQISYHLSQKMLLNFVAKTRSEPGYENFFNDLKNK